MPEPLLLPQPSVPVVRADGRIDADWYRFFAELVRRINAGGL